MESAPTCSHSCDETGVVAPAHESREKGGDARALNTCEGGPGEASMPDSDQLARQQLLGDEELELQPSEEDESELQSFAEGMLNDGGRQGRQPEGVVMDLVYDKVLGSDGFGLDDLDDWLLDLLEAAIQTWVDLGIFRVADGRVTSSESAEAGGVG